MINLPELLVGVGAGALATFIVLRSIVLINQWKSDRQSRYRKLENEITDLEFRIFDLEQSMSKPLKLRKGKRCKKHKS